MTPPVVYRPPRSGVLGVWLRAWRTGLVSPDQVVDAVTDGDGDHDVADLPAAVAEGNLGPADLITALGSLSSVPVEAVRVVLPAPGDPRGLPVPNGPDRAAAGAFGPAALEAGEALLAGDLGLVPRVRQYTSGSGDCWSEVTWQCFAPLPPVPADPITVGEADHDLLVAMREATEALAALQVARALPETERGLGGLRGADPLPPGTSGRVRRLHDRAVTVLGALHLADLSGDGGLLTAGGVGGAITAAEAVARDGALRPVATAARRALVAAYNAPPG